MNPVKSISAQDALTLPQGSVIIDVRNDPELVDCRLETPCLHVPLDLISGDVLRTEHGLNNNMPLYMLCRAGVRARNAAETLSHDGFTDITVIEGGILACCACGHETLTGPF